MKQKDIALIVVVAVVSIVVATLASSLLLGGSSAREQKAEVVDVISADFDQPSKDYFNEKSIDPTLLIRIGDNSNQAPFKQSQ
jgi:hypothetical protein